MTGRALLAALLLCGTVPAYAGAYFASPDGNDQNDCLTPQTACRQGHAAVRKMTAGHHGLTLAAGQYDPIDVSHHKSVAVSGSIGADSPCLDPNLVNVPRIVVQDNATIWVSCLTTGSISSRQWSIVDVADVVFDGTSRTALAAGETSRINTASTVWLNGNAVVFAIAENYSTIFLAGRIVVSQPNLSLAHFLQAVDSTIDLRDAVFSGFPLAAGLRFLLDHGVIIFPAAGSESIPGNGSDSVNFSICRPCN